MESMQLVVSIVTKKVSLADIQNELAQAQASSAEDLTLQSAKKADRYKQLISTMKKVYEISIYLIQTKKEKMAQHTSNLTLLI
jgi:hypothetical protein